MSDTITIKVQVKPGARTEGISAGDADVVIVKVRAKPVDGQANTAVISALSKYLEVAKSKIELVSGHKSKLKRFAISLEGRDDIEKRLEKLFNE